MITFRPLSSCAIGFVAVFILSGRSFSADYLPVAPGQAHCCASESAPMLMSPPAFIQQRFTIYRQAGFDMLRVDGLDDSMLGPNGDVHDPGDMAYLQMALDSGFRIKLNVRTFVQPDEYLNLHQGSRFVDEDGAEAHRAMSYWYPDLQQRVREATQAIFKYMAAHNMFRNVDLIAPDFGCASEPIYPAFWTQSGNAQKKGEAFWFYGPYAQADFAAKMKIKYGTIAAANASWRTSFAGFDSIEIPYPGTQPGPFWSDVLVWYRNTKRNFILFQIGNFKRELAKYPEAQNIKLLLYVPGTHCSKEDWNEAIATGNGGSNIRLMCDSEFLMETAQKEGCVLQYTGCNNEAEVHYLVNYLNDHRLNVPMWGENAQKFATEVGHIANVVIDYRLAGLDYTHTSAFFDSDLITPNGLLPQVTDALNRIHGSFGDAPKR